MRFQQQTKDGIYVLCNPLQIGTMPLVQGTMVTSLEFLLVSELPKKFCTYDDDDDNDDDDSEDSDDNDD